MEVEIIHFDGCPNLPDTREHLMQAFAESGSTPQWKEWNRDDPESPAYARHYGSPTILADGRDVTGTPPWKDGDTGCRVYLNDSGVSQGAPAINTIVAALVAADDDVSVEGAGRASIKWRNLAAALPAVGAAALPKVACPACWPAYSGLLGAAGAGFINYTPYLLPLTVLFVGLSLASLGWGCATATWLSTAVVRVDGGGSADFGQVCVRLRRRDVRRNRIVDGCNSVERTAANRERRRIVPGLRAWQRLDNEERRSIMNSLKLTVEIFSSGCSICKETISLVKSIGCESCNIIVHDMRKDSVAQRALQLGVRSLPAIAINGKLADCCAGRGPDEATLRAAGLGQS